MAMTAEESNQFHNRGRDIITEIAKAVDDADSYSRVFEIRGGAGGMAELGPQTETMVVFWNDLRAFLAGNGNQNQHILDQYRTDY